MGFLDPEDPNVLGHVFLVCVVFMVGMIGLYKLWAWVSFSVNG